MYGLYGYVRCEGYGFQAVYSRVAFRIGFHFSFFRKLISWLKILSRLGIVLQGFVLARLCDFGSFWKTATLG